MAQLAHPATLDSYLSTHKRAHTAAVCLYLETFGLVQEAPRPIACSHEVQELVLNKLLSV